VPAFVAPLVGFSLGVLLALHAVAHRSTFAGAAQAVRAAPPDLRGRATALAALFSGLIFTPICAYFLIFAPDWSLAYLIEARRIPSAVDLILLALDAISVPVGLLAGGRLLSRGALREVAALAGAPLAVALLAVLVLSRRLAIDGTYRQVHGDFGTDPVAGGPLGYALLWMHTMLAAGFVVTFRALLARSAEAAAPAAHPEARSAPPPKAPAPPRLGRRR
jgi:hypothetical protein